MSSSILFMKLFSLLPPDLPEVQRRNFINVQIDAIGVGIAIATAPFIPVLLTRLGASSMQVGLLASIPALTGLIFSVPLGRFLEKTKNIVRAFSLSRLIVFLSSVPIGFAPLLLPSEHAITAILILSALVTIPNTLVGLGFTIIMNEVAGPSGRYHLLSRRWSLIQLSYSIAVAGAGFLLVRIPFPQGYALLFTLLTVGAFISYNYSRRIEIPCHEPSSHALANGFRERTSALFSLVSSHRPLLGFNARRFILYLGVFALVPVYPLYFVRELNAADSWIGAIATAQSITLLLGYFFWTEIQKRKGTSFVLKTAMIGSSLYPFLLASTTNLPAILCFALLTGVFQAGVDLILFDEMLKRIPYDAQAPLVSYSQTVFYLASIIGPFIGTFLADHLGLLSAVILAGLIRFGGAASFCSLPAAPESESSVVEAV